MTGRRMMMFLLVVCFLFSCCGVKGYCAASKSSPKKVKIKIGDETFNYKVSPYPLIVKGKKVNTTSSPIFIRGNEYYGSVDTIFVKSRLNVEKSVGDKGVILRYGSRIIEIPNGDNYIYEKTSLDAEGIANRITGTPFTGSYSYSSNWVIRT